MALGPGGLEALTASLKSTEHTNPLSHDLLSPSPTYTGHQGAAYVCIRSNVKGKHKMWYQIVFHKKLPYAKSARRASMQGCAGVRVCLSAVCVFGWVYLYL